MKLKSKVRSENFPKSDGKELENTSQHILVESQSKTGSPITISSRVSVSSVSLSSTSSVISDEGTDNIANSPNTIAAGSAISDPAETPSIMPLIHAGADTASTVAKKKTRGSVAKSTVPGKAATKKKNLFGTKRKVSDPGVAYSPSIPGNMNVPSIVNVVSKDEVLHRLHQQNERNCIEPEMPLLAYQQHIEDRQLGHSSKRQKTIVARIGAPITPGPLAMPKPLTGVPPKMPSLLSSNNNTSFCVEAPTQECSSKDSTPSDTLRLSLPEDETNLNPIHHFVRRNIEVFVATDVDIAAPSPGRKNAIVRGQVGLRCVHCRNVSNRNRTKRAVCYPSKISRVYNCVSDMKFDHFAHCKFLPEKERKLFDELKTKQGATSRGKGGNNTARYYYESAVKMGMVEAPNGIVLLNRRVSLIDSSSMPSLPSDVSAASDDSHTSLQICSPKPKNNNLSGSRLVPASNSRIPMPSLSNSTEICPPAVLSSAIKSNSRPLASPSDALVLNPVHCFVRNNVEVFMADSKDVSAPAPGRKKRVRLGQVGIRCIHCKNLPTESRVKRAICYPPTIASLYHAISNMKFDHFGACKGLSPSMRQNFADLKESSRRKGHWTAASSTAKYYRESAEKDLGLIDTDNGIRVTNHSFLQTSNPLQANTQNNTTPTLDKCGEIVHVVHKDKQMDGMSALMLVATDSKIRQQYEELSGRFPSRTWA